MPYVNRTSRISARRRESGITLVEVLLAIMIFAVGVLAAALMLGNALSYSASARHITEASEIAQHKLETLLNAPYHHPDLDAASSPHGPFAVDGYSLTWQVAQDAPMSRMKMINLNVTWQEKGKAKNLGINALRQ